VSGSHPGSNIIFLLGTGSLEPADLLLEIMLTRRVLIKTSRSGTFIDEPKVARIIAASSKSGGFFYKSMYAKSGAKGKGEKRAGGGAARQSGSAVRAKDGDTVGEGAQRIGTENIGHKLLSMMG
jgi:hypothetical protein